MQLRLLHFKVTFGMMPFILIFISDNTQDALRDCPSADDEEFKEAMNTWSAERSKTFFSNDIH
jgi:hypothetical protein